MVDLWESDDPDDARLARSADGGLAAFNAAGVLTAADVHVATRTGELAGETDADVRLAVALAVRAARHGSVCVDLTRLEEEIGPAAGEPLPWPAAPDWPARVAASPLATSSVVRVDGGLLYLDRYWREEIQVHDDLVARLGPDPVGADLADTEAVTTAAARLFPGEGYAEQRDAALAALRQRTTVLTGGPGTGKTTTVAGLLALLAGADTTTPLRIALTAPTGKAAARLQETIQEACEEAGDAQQAAAEPRPRFTAEERVRLSGLTAATLHRLLGWRPGSRTRFRHHRGNRLPHDVIVVDETSMVSLTMMARLLEAVRPETRLVLVGDPDQLASVEAGAVLSDLVDGLAVRAPAAVAPLTATHRYRDTGSIGALAQAVRESDADRVLDLLSGDLPDLRLVDPADPTAMDAVRSRLTEHAVAVRAAAVAGHQRPAVTAAERQRLLCAHREGAWGAEHWNRQVERWLGEVVGTPIGAARGQEWYAGRPVLVTANDYGLGLFNGDTGLTVLDHAPDGAERLRVVMADGRLRSFAPSRLGDVETLHAMTVHKSQGSQTEDVTVLLPEPDSPLLTRELFYTAITRARRSVCVVGSEEAVRIAVATTARRATGLRGRLAGDTDPEAMTGGRSGNLGATGDR